MKKLFKKEQKRTSVIYVRKHIFWRKISSITIRIVIDVKRVRRINTLKTEGGREEQEQDGAVAFVSVSTMIGPKDAIILPGTLRRMGKPWPIGNTPRSYFHYYNSLASFQSGSSYCGISKNLIQYLAGISTPQAEQKVTRKAIAHHSCRTFLSSSPHLRTQCRWLDWLTNWATGAERRLIRICTKRNGHQSRPSGLTQTRVLQGKATALTTDLQARVPNKSFNQTKSSPCFLQDHQFLQKMSSTATML